MSKLKASSLRENICLECKKTFMAKHKDTEYCSKSCKNKSWRRQNPSYHRNWLLVHPEQIIKKRILNRKLRERMTEEQKQKRRDHAKILYKKNPKRCAARRKAYRKIELGKKCEVCGINSRLERHHPDYAKPLVVKTVCVFCHRKIHLGELIT